MQLTKNSSFHSRVCHSFLRQENSFLSALNFEKPLKISPISSGLFGVPEPGRGGGAQNAPPPELRDY